MYTQLGNPSFNIFELPRGKTDGRTETTAILSLHSQRGNKMSSDASHYSHDESG